MLESPLRKNKHAYPIDFSSKNKSKPNNNIKKYDTNYLQQNPETISQQNNSIFSKKYSINQLSAQSNHKSKRQNKQLQEKLINTKNYEQSKRQNQSSQQLKIHNQIDLQDTQQPLKQVKRRNQRMIVDENKLKNPRIQLNQQKNINQTQKTLQIQSPFQQQKKVKNAQVGGIRHQDLGIYQKYQNQKQIPLSPEQPFDLVHKNMRKNSLLSKLRLNKIQQNNYSHDQSKNYHNYIVNQHILDQSYNNHLSNDDNTHINSKIFKGNRDFNIFSGNKHFRPESYTYANNFISSNSNNESNNQNLKRAKSSFQAQQQRSQKIIYMKNGQNDSFSFNLPNISFDNDLSKFKKPCFSNNFSLNSRFANKQILQRLKVSKNKFNNIDHQQNQLISKFQPNSVIKLKEQINLIAKNKFRQKQAIQQQQRHTQRQFTFHAGQQKHSFSHDKKKLSNSQQVSPKKRLQITYHVPLVQLKSICKKYLSNTSMYRIAFKVPKIFMESNLFYRTQQKQQLHYNSLILFQSLKISSKNLIVKRYSNCIIFTTGHIAVIWYYNGKRYLGGWQYEYLDEGSRHGLGLQWEPNKFIYYGQFRNNKKYGLGTIKQGPEQVLAGYWSNDKYIGINFRQEDQKLISEDEKQQQQPQQAYFNRNYENQELQLQYRQ